MKKILTLAIILILGVSCVSSKSTHSPKDFSEQITEKYWKLTQLNNQAVKMAEHQKREAYFIMKANENGLTGFSGCNNFSGKYQLKGENEVEFSSIIGTLKACQYLDYKEAEFYRVFTKTKTYRIENDHLQFISNDGQVLAEFQAIYF